MQAFRKVAVIGSGVMGATIAAHVANGGVPVLLLDIVPSGGGNRNALAGGALARMMKSEPAPFMSDDATKLVSIGNTEDDLDQLANCDWIIEVIVETLAVKQSLYRQIDPVRRPGTVVSSNTSTIPFSQLIEGMPEAFERDFLITHFFNPPRHMRLLEIVAGPKSDPALVERVVRFADVKLGKSIVRCKDSPGFIANRLGVYWLQLGVQEALASGLSVEEADAIMSRPFGIPKTGVFGLIDLVGLDLMPRLAKSLGATLKPDDPFHSTVHDIPLITRMIAEGLTGRKARGGFYRLERRGTHKEKQAMDLASGLYRPECAAQLPELDGAGKDLRKLFSSGTRAGLYAWRVIGRVLAYAADLIPEAANDVVAIDEAMRLGYNWSFGPFELIDQIGVAWLVENLQADGVAVPTLLAEAAGEPFYRVKDGRRQYLSEGSYCDIVRSAGVIVLDDVKLASRPVLKSASAALWDIGDGVACFELAGKGNAIDQAAILLLAQAIESVKAQFKALVIYSDAAQFSSGTNLSAILFTANIAAWETIDAVIAAGQATFQALKYAPFPVVAAPAGMALGGGCEILLHADAVQAYAETYAGLVECGVGLVPAWGGCKEMLMRSADQGRLPGGPMPAPNKLFEMISTATVSKSAAQAMTMAVLRSSDSITMNRSRLLADAKERALALVAGYVPPAPPQPIRLPGVAGKLAMDLAVTGYRNRGLATEHDATVFGALAEVLSGGDADPLDLVTEDDLLKLERRAFMELVRNPKTLARIEATLGTGKPLRN